MHVLVLAGLQKSCFHFIGFVALELSRLRHHISATNLAQRAEDICFHVDRLVTDGDTI